MEKDQKKSWDDGVKSVLKKRGKSELKTVFKIVSSSFSWPLVQ